MMNMILKKNEGGGIRPPGLEDLKKSPGFKGLIITIIFISLLNSVHFYNII